MAIDEIHVNDIGTTFRATIYEKQASGTTAVLDISGINTTTGRQFVFQQPSGSTTTQTATFLTSGTDGTLVFTSTTGFLSSSGEWRLQCVISVGSNTFHTDVYKFTVHENI